MPQYAFLLGRHAALSAVECWQTLGTLGIKADIVTADRSCLIVSTPAPLPDTFLQRLGGTDRIATVLSSLDHEPTPAEILSALPSLPPKWTLGVSAIGTSLNIKPLALAIKKLAREQESRLKFVLPTRGASHLNAAQVIFNDLHQEPNAELTILKIADRYYVTRTVQIQDIKAYELRDTSRPARDAKVGMLPPKLAQIMLNVAAAEFPVGAKPAILDPFCGSGTVLQEGWLMGYKMIGSDASRTMIEAAHENLQWLNSHMDTPPNIEPELALHDVQQPFPQEWHNSINAVVTEPHLGRPLTTPLPYAEFANRAEELGRLYTMFFRHVYPVLKNTSRVLFILPAVKTVHDGKEAFTPLPDTLIDEIEKCGYHMKQLVPGELAPFYESSSRGTLLYHRPDALVARELTLWQKT